jgi:hypothetical protein
MFKRVTCSWCQPSGGASRDPLPTACHSYRPPPHPTLNFGVLVFLSTWPPARPRDVYIRVVAGQAGGHDTAVPVSLLQCRQGRTRMNTSSSTQVRYCQYSRLHVCVYLLLHASQMHI